MCEGTLVYTWPFVTSGPFMSPSLFNALHLIKAFGALLVVTCHYAGHYYHFSFYSYGTGCFFVVTGYYALNWERSRGLHYILKRLLRLYPAYVVAVFAYLFTKAPPLDLWPALIFHHLTFLLTTTDRATVFALNPPFWSLPVFFTFFVLIAVLPRLTPRLWHVVVFILMAMAAIALGLTDWREGYIELWVAPLHLAAFWLGGWLGHLAHRRPIVPSSGYTVLAVALMALAIGCGFIYQPLLDSLFSQAGFYFRGVMVLIYGALFWALLHSHLITRRSELLAFLGTISFGVYLFHNLPVYWFGSALTGAGGMLLAFAVSILLAWLSWRFVESPLLTWCKPRLARLHIGS